MSHALCILLLMICKEVHFSCFLLHFYWAQLHLVLIFAHYHWWTIVIVFRCLPGPLELSLRTQPGNLNI